MESENRLAPELVDKAQSYAVGHKAAAEVPADEENIVVWPGLVTEVVHIVRGTGCCVSHSDTVAAEEHPGIVKGLGVVDIGCVHNSVEGTVA